MAGRTRGSRTPPKAVARRNVQVGNRRAVADIMEDWKKQNPAEWDAPTKDAALEVGSDVDKRRSKRYS